MASSLSSEKHQLEREIAQLVQDHGPVPNYLGSPIDSNVRSRLQSWAKERNKVAEKRGRLEMIFEEERIEAVRRELEELHPQVKYECALCLEEVNESSRSMFVCCGQGSCSKCADDNKNRDKSIKITRCPLCRHRNLGGSGTERYENIHKFAKRGEAWAQTLMGDIYMGKDECVQQKVNMAKAKEWYKLAKDQGFPNAIFYLAEMKINQDDGDRGETRYRQEVKRAAELGSMQAADRMATLYMLEGPDSFKEMLLYATIALGSVSNATKQAYISTMLGMAHYTLRKPISEHGSEWSQCYRAKYYLEIGAKTDFDFLSVPSLRKMASFLYAGTLLSLGAGEYCGYAYEIPGFSFLPKVQYWALKYGKTNFIAEGPVGRHETRCANCNCEAPPETKFKQCVRCKAAWYCSKQCQTESWKAGHKFDCKQRF